METKKVKIIECGKEIKLVIKQNIFGLEAIFRDQSYVQNVMSDHLERLQIWMGSIPGI
jgi:hypothetical protein